jgi:hypothetical protein
MAQPSLLSLAAPTSPIKFGTDGWRGVIAADFTFERLVQVALKFWLRPISSPPAAKQ